MSTGLVVGLALTNALAGYVAGGVRMARQLRPTIAAGERARAEAAALAEHVDQLVAQLGQLQRRVMEETLKNKKAVAK